MLLRPAVEKKIIKIAKEGERALVSTAKISLILFLCDSNDSLLVYFSIYGFSFLFLTCCLPKSESKDLQSNLPVLGQMSTLTFTYK